MIKSSMEEDLRSASAPAGNPPADDIPRAGETFAPAPTAASQPDVISDDYAGNLAYQKNLTAARKTETQPAAENSAEAVSGLQAEESLPLEAVPLFAPEPVALPGEPSDLPPSSNLVGMQKDLGEAFARKRVKRKMKKNTLLIVILIVLLAIFSLFFFQHKNQELSPVSPATDSTAVADPFAAVRNHNDAARMRGVTTLANIAAVYHLEEKADLPLSADYVKLNEDNPVSDFFKEALRRYGKSEELLHDPDGDGNYYAYRSPDGLSFQLSAKLEDKKSNSCVEDPCLFEKVISAQDLAIMSLDPEQYK